MKLTWKNSAGEDLQPFYMGQGRISYNEKNAKFCLTHSAPEIFKLDYVT